MKTKLTLQEKLKDLRNERNLKLADVEKQTGIVSSTISRYETDENQHIPYQELVKMAKFYKVSMDYLCGMTNHRNLRNTPIDELEITDEAVSFLKSKKANNRLVSELLAHEDFPQHISAMEVYIDGKISDQVANMNAVFKFAEQILKENVNVSDNDEVMSFLRESTIDENEYLRFRIADRFNGIMKSLFDAHKKDSLSDSQTALLNLLSNDVKEYINSKESPERRKLNLLAQQIGLNTADLTKDEVDVLMAALKKSKKYKDYGRKNK